MSTQIETSKQPVKKSLTGARNALIGCVKQVSGRAVTCKQLKQHPGYRIFQLERLPGQIVKVLAVLGPVVSGVRHDRNKLVAWFFRYPELFAEVDIVYLSYGQSWRAGSKARVRSSKSDSYKDHFRRFAWAKDVKAHYNDKGRNLSWQEIHGRFCPENIERFFTGQRLLQRYVRGS